MGAGVAAKVYPSPTAKRGLQAYAKRLAWKLQHDIRGVSSATADRRDAVCAALGISADKFEERSARFEAGVRSRHPEVVSRMGCLAADVLAAYSSRVIYERSGLHLAAAKRARRRAVSAVEAAMFRAIASSDEPQLPESEAYGGGLAVDGGAW